MQTGKFVIPLDFPEERQVDLEVEKIRNFINF